MSAPVWRLHNYRNYLNSAFVHLLLSCASSEIKRIKLKRAASSSSVDGFSNSSDIADLFADKFHELYTTVDYDKDELLDICNDLNVSLHDVTPTPFYLSRQQMCYVPLKGLNLGSMMVTPDLALIILLMLATN